MPAGHVQDPWCYTDTEMLKPCACPPALLGQYSGLKLGLCMSVDHATSGRTYMGDSIVCMHMDAACVTWLTTTLWEDDSVLQDHLPGLLLGLLFMHRLTSAATSRILLTPAILLRYASNCMGGLQVHEAGLC